MIPNRFKIIYEVTRKELFEHFKTKRLLVISIVFAALFLIIAVYGGYLVGGTQGDEPAYKAGANSVLTLILAFTSLFPPILAIALSYDTIVGERTRRSLHLVLSKPVDRSSIFIGKFLGAFLSISAIYLIVGTAGYIVVIVLSGKVPSINEVGKAYAAMGVILFSAACWVLFIMLFSTSFKTVTSTIIFSVLFWFIILSLVSQSGWIYYMATREDTEEPITIDISTQATFGNINNTVLTFTPHRFDNWVLGVDFDVLDANGTEVLPFESAGFGFTSLIPTYMLKPGEYTWEAKYQEDNKDSPKNIASGSIYIDEDFLPVTSLSSTSDSDNKNIDDFILYLGKVTENSTTTFDITITFLNEDKLIEQESNYSGSYIFLDDLAEGDYRVTVMKNNLAYLNTTFHSYGNKQSQEQFFGLIDEDVEYPGYVKFTAALNPDNCAGVYYEILTGESSSSVYLTIGEAIIALTIMFIFLFGLGVLIFSRIELL